MLCSSHLSCQSAYSISITDFSPKKFCVARLFFIVEEKKLIDGRLQCPGHIMSQFE